MNNKKKYVKPQVKCYVIKKTCQLLVSSNKNPEYGGELG